MKKIEKAFKDVDCGICFVMEGNNAHMVSKGSVADTAMATATVVLENKNNMYSHDIFSYLKATVFCLILNDEDLAHDFWKSLQDVCDREDNKKAQIIKMK